MEPFFYLLLNLKLFVAIMFRFKIVKNQFSGVTHFTSKKSSGLQNARFDRVSESLASGFGN